MAFGAFKAGSGFLGAAVTAQVTAALGVAPAAGDVIFVSCRAPAPLTMTAASGWTLHFSFDTGTSTPSFYFSRRCTGSEGTGAQQFGTSALSVAMRITWELRDAMPESLLEVARLVAA